MHLSIVIPTYNEADNIEETIRHLQLGLKDKPGEIIVSDGGSDDDTLEKAQSLGVNTYSSPVKGRAGQMNYGVSQASGDVLYFVHADSQPPLSFYEDIKNALSENHNCGGYRFKFDSNKWIFILNNFLTHINWIYCRGGDQSIFCTKDLFMNVGQFREEMLIMEDYDFLKKIRKKGNFKLIPKSTLVSARKYLANSWLKVMRANIKVVSMYRKGATQQELLETYRKMLDYRKNAF